MRGGLDGWVVVHPDGAVQQDGYGAAVVYRERADAIKVAVDFGGSVMPLIPAVPPAPRGRGRKAAAE